MIGNHKAVIVLAVFLISQACQPPLQQLDRLVVGREGGPTIIIGEQYELGRYGREVGFGISLESKAGESCFVGWTDAETDPNAFTVIVSNNKGAAVSILLDGSEVAHEFRGVGGERLRIHLDGSEISWYLGNDKGGRLIKIDKDGVLHTVDEENSKR